MPTHVAEMVPFFAQIHPVEREILEEYLSHYEPYSAKRRELLTSAGQVERYMYFVKEGIQRSYGIHDGKEHVMAFTYPPSFTGVPESFYLQRPSRFYLECITPSEFYRISYEKHQALIEQHRPIETLFRRGAEIILSGIIERHFELQAFDIETRFRIFTQRSSHLLNMVPHKHIASYLRIDPTNFSKLLGKLKI